MEQSAREDFCHSGPIALGTLCVIDRQPRRLSDEQRTALRDLADEVMEQIRIRT